MKHIKAITRTAALVIALAIASTTAAVATTSGTASASGVKNLSFCLKYSNGSPYASKPVYLYRHNGSKWVSYRQGSTGSNGCATWRNVAANSYYYTQGYWTYNIGWNYYAYSGNTQAAYVGDGIGTYGGGSGVVYHYRLA